MATTHVDVIVYDSAITAMVYPGGLVWRWANQKSRRVATLAKANAPKRTGQMAASISSYYVRSERDQVEVGVSADSPAAWVHEGTARNGTGYIYPDGRFLRLPAEAGHPVTYLRRVRGQAAQPFLEDALEAVIRTL